MKENKKEKVSEYERAPGFRPRLAIYHANAKGTGCAIKMELHPAVGADMAESLLNRSFLTSTRRRKNMMSNRLP